jgi:hypothetical protein
MRTRSAKAKGRRLQNAVAQAIRERFNLQPDDVRPAVMGDSGEDIKLSSAARTFFPFAVECKNTERLDVWGAIRQAEANAGEHIPAVIFTRNRAKTYVILEFDRFLEVLCDRTE